MRISLRINGEQHDADVWEGESLLYALRERFGFPGSKNACEQGECGSCTVYLDGTPVCACLVAAGQVEGREIGTVEGMAGEESLHPVQQAFLDAGAVQCGFCTGGMVMSVRDLLRRNPRPSVEEIKEGIEGNFCRCTGYETIVDAVEQVARQRRGDEPAVTEGAHA